MTTAETLNYYYEIFDKKSFIEDDPISIPHLFTKKEDIEISGFLASTIAWGNRKAIIKSARDLITRMDNAPYDFLINAQKHDMQALCNFYYRTFKECDLKYFITALSNIYTLHGGLEEVFTEGYRSAEKDKIKNSIIHFRDIFLELEHLQRVTKHLGDPAKGSAAKRINMFLRWMVREDSNGVDFGLWKDISSADLIIPLDVHVCNIGKQLGLIPENASGWKAAEMLTSILRTLDPKDPVKYDFALFGTGNAQINFKHAK
ncbi:MAG: TIGR02757 family protein [Bacteroidales bacterium]|nr:TIGR02757 family protein [Bacteroidales bacterium]